MGSSSLRTVQFANLMALAIIMMTFLSVLSVSIDTLVPPQYLQDPRLAEVCVGQRIIQGVTRYVWLQGVWLSAPPLPRFRTTIYGQEFNQRGTACGIIPWFSGTPGWWYQEIR